MSTTQIAKSQFDRIVADFRRYAGEVLKVEFFDSAFWAFGSEIATLRILAHYRRTPSASQGFSENLGTHYFRLNVPGFDGEMSTEDGG